MNEGLRASDALTAVDVVCDHERWNVLNKDVGCIHIDHGGHPAVLSDHHSGLRLVGGVPTRYLPADRRAS